MFGFDHVRLWSCSSFSTNKIELTLRTRSWVRLVKWQLAAEITSFFNVESELRNKRIYKLAFTKKCKFLMFGDSPIMMSICFAQTPETCKLSCIKQSVLKLVQFIEFLSFRTLWMVSLLRLCLDNVTRISFRVGTFEGRSIAFFFCVWSTKYWTVSISEGLYW